MSTLKNLDPKKLDEARIRSAHYASIIPALKELWANPEIRKEYHRWKRNGKKLKPSR